MKHIIPQDLAESFFRENIDLATKTSSGYVGRCPVCGDSQKSSSKKRLYLLYKPDRGWSVYCHNCELSQSLLYFVRDYFPSIYGSFKSNCVKTYFKEFTNTDNKTEDVDSKLKRALERKLKRKKEKQAKKDLVKKEPKTELEIFYENCNPLNDKQREYFIKRNLPKKIIDTIRVCGYVKDKKYWKYSKRMIIPFFDDSNKIYYFQARTLDKEVNPKYINWDGLDSKPEYNEFFVDKSKDTYIIEGMIDSMFVDNSISVLGVKFSQDKLLYLKNKYPKGVYCLDNDEDGIKWTKKLLKMNYKCLVFPSKYKNLKDLNDIVINTGDTNLTSFIKENTYIGVLGLMKLQQLIRS